MIRFRDWKLTGSIDACQADHKTIVFTVTGLPKEYFKWELIWVFGSYVDILPLTLNAEGDIASKVFERENLPFAGFYTAQLRGHNRAGGTRHTNEIVIKVGGTYSEDVKFPTLPNSFAAYMDALNLHEGNIENPHKTTAAQVGARPDTWLPTITEIGAAPAGYGLGEEPVEVSLADLDNIYQNGWYRVSVGGQVGGVYTEYADTRIDAWGSNRVKQTLSLHRTYGSTLIRRKDGNGGGWQEWEWVNPPMVPGVEYRTTERWQDAPVYTKLILVSIDAFADYAEMYLIPHNISNFDESVSVDVSWLGYSGYWRHFPGSWFGDANWSTQANASRTDVNLEIGTAAHAQVKESTKPLRIVLRYTKTTY